jgi:hypothetical protein
VQHYSKLPVARIQENVDAGGKISNVDHFEESDVSSYV